LLPARGVAVVLKEGNTGGGFGVRGELNLEDSLVCLQPSGSVGRSNG
jgi:hypothetical protein